MRLQIQSEAARLRSQIDFFFYLSTKTYVVGTQKNALMQRATKELNLKGNHILKAYCKFSGL